MIIDILWVVLVTLLLLNLRQYRKKDIAAIQDSLTDLRNELLARLRVLETSLIERRDTRNVESGVYRELKTMRDELAVIIGCQKGNIETDDLAESADKAVISETERKQDVEGK